jgi:hypothetical protein
MAVVVSMRREDAPMEENREQAPAAGLPGIHPIGVLPTVPPAPPPVPHADWTAQGIAYTTPPAATAQAAQAPAAPVRVGSLTVAARLARLILLRLLAGLVRVGRALRPHVGWLAALTVLFAIIVTQAFLLVAPRIFRSVTTDTRVALLPPPPAVISFLEGQSTYNADMIWEAFSPELQADLNQRGASKELIAAQVEDERLAGRRYRTISYIGGIQLGERSRYYYVIDIDSPQPDQAGSFSFIFTVNRDGKIVGIQRE